MSTHVLGILAFKLQHNALKCNFFLILCLIINQEENILPVSKEDLLISDSCLARQNSQKKRNIKKIIGEFTGWQEFSKKDISLVVYYNLKKTSLLNLIPSQINRKLERLFLSNTACNINHLENLAQLIQKLKQEKIPVIILKGAALCDTVYPHTGIRAFCDLDILIHKKDIPKVIKTLKQLDYSISHTHAQHHFSAFKKSGRTLPLEVHWNLVNDASPFQKYAFKLSLDKLWQEAVPLEISGAEALWLSPEHQLIYLSVHMLKEGYSNRKWLLDIYYLLEFYRGKMDWQKLLADCREFQTTRPVYYALSTLDELFHMIEMNEGWLDRKVLQELKPQRITRLEKSIFNRLLKNKPLNTYFYRFFLYVFAIERLSDKMKALLSLLKYSFQLPYFKLKVK